MKQFAFISFTVIAFLGCASAVKFLPVHHSFRWNQPNEVIALPESLHEISGITVVDDSTLACVQDENGLVFLYDIRQKTVRKVIDFYTDGDYEGVAMVRKNMWVLRSDGTLFRVKNYLSPDLKVDSFHTKIPAYDNEGFCFDAANDRLLIGSKSKISKAKEDKDLRAIYAFDIKKKKLSKEPVITLHLDSLYAYAEKHGIQLHTNVEGKKAGLPSMKIKISGLFIHPTTNDLFILSAADYHLIQLSSTGEIKDLVALPPELFKKAEGIAIFKNGTCYVSNEGKEGKPNLLQFLPL